MKSNSSITKFMALIITALSACVLLSACSDSEVLSEEDKVRATLTALEEAAEQRSLSAMLEHISPSYQDFEGNDLKSVTGLLQLQLIRNQRINIFSKIQELEVIDDAATVEMSVAMASREVDLSSEENRLRADTHRFSILLKRDQKQWKIHSVSWKRGW